jgi:hypothetical protein
LDNAVSFSYWFDFGRESDFSKHTTFKTGQGQVSYVEATVTDLSPSVRYNFRLKFNYIDRIGMEHALDGGILYFNTAAQ